MAAFTATGIIAALAVREGSRRSRLRGHLSRLPGQHRIRQGIPQRDRLRRLRGRRCDERGGIFEDAAARRQRSSGNHGLEPRRLHHPVQRVSRSDPVQGGRSNRAGHESGVPAVVQGPVRTSAASRRRSAFRGCPSKSPISTSSGRPSTASTSCRCRSSCTSRPTTRT